MRWDKEAEELLARAPFFVRPLARRRVEEFARAQGAARVSGAIAQQAYQALRAKAQSDGAPGAESDLLPPAAEIEHLESQAESLARDPQFRTRHFQVRPCAGAVGCPRSIIPVRQVAQALTRCIADSGFPEFLEQGTNRRPILSHHRFHAAVAGCPNACSQPQVQDFGVIGVTAIRINADRCDGCRRCVKACREGAIQVRQAAPAIDPQRCIECGDCARACPTGALRFGAPGYVIFAGGKLGRHPCLATRLGKVARVSQVLAAGEAALRALMTQGRPGERLAALIQRAGADFLAAAVRE